MKHMEVLNIQLSLFFDSSCIFFLLQHLFFITASILPYSNDGSASPSEVVDGALSDKNDEFKNLLHTSRILLCEMQPYTSPTIGNKTQFW